MIRSLFLLLLIKLPLFALVFAVTATTGSIGYFHFAPAEQTCQMCHATLHTGDEVALTGHRYIDCQDCHGSFMNAGWHGAGHAIHQLIGLESIATDERHRLSEEHLLGMMDACRQCHGYAFDKWAGAGHSMTYSEFLLNEEHNRTEQLNEDCFRCHGMFFEGRIKDAVEPLNTEGPWKLVSNSLQQRPAIPCMACHAVHAIDAVLKSSDNPEQASPTGTKAKRKADLCIYSRNERQPIPATSLRVPTILQDGEPIRVEDDGITQLCMQCHAPNSHHQLGTGDDLTAVGVHEGIGCAHCHRAHSQDATDSCSNCHPKRSNCGLDVTTMDTSFADPNSKHNIHTVACADCHIEKGAENKPHTN